MTPGTVATGGANIKTIKCRYNEAGLCKYGSACHFAHGDSELRSP